MLQKLRKQDDGFTIIEVLIVLAIAGLILLIVFLAVPALQRNSRNTQYRTASAAVLGGVSEYVNNNNGQLPLAITSVPATGVVTIGAAGTAQAQAKIQGGFNAELNAGEPPETGRIFIASGQKCSGTGGGITPAARAFAARFLVETAGGTSLQCVES